MENKLIYKVLILLVLAGVAVARMVECFECSWVGGKPLDDERRKELDAARKEQAGMSIPIHNPLASRYFSQITRPLPQNLTKNCNKCKLESGLCIRWTFLTNDIPLNATYMCVQSAEEKGIFTQKMDGSLVKEVLICDTDNCNHGERYILSKIMLTSFVLLLILRKKIGL